MKPMSKKEEVLDILTHGSLALKGQFTLGSNYTFLVSAALHGRSLKAVYKPVKGGIPLYDFAPASLARREVAAYLLSEALGWDFVPPTVIRRRAPYGMGSLQEFIPHDPQANYFSFDEKIRQSLCPVVVFDLLLNNADRKGSHILRDRQGELKLIDHGLCFHAEPKLRTVIWDFGGQPIPKALLGDVSRLLQDLAPETPLQSALAEYLSELELKALGQRAAALLAHPFFPLPDPERRPFPWPLV